MTISAESSHPRPSLRFMLRDPAHVIAFSGGVGLAPFAPGTFGTLLALPLQWWLAPRFAEPVWLGALTVAFIIGIWACGRTVAFLLVLVFTPDDKSWQALAFLLFRAFDIVKPPPIRYFDARWKSGFGVMFDDLLAAFFTLLVLAMVKVWITGL